MLKSELGKGKTMRPVETLFGPTGVLRVNLDLNDDAMVVCRNSFTHKDNFFYVDLETGMKIAMWIADGKPGNVQDAFPELTVDQREMMISGMTPEDWEYMTA